MANINSEQKTSFRAIFVGDSLMNPRYVIGLRPEETYAYLLEMFWRKSFPNAYARSLILPGTRIKQLSDAFHDYFIPNEGGIKLDVSVIHLGIVDCAPRPLSPLMLFVAEHLPKPLPGMIQSFLHNNRAWLLKSGWSFRYTSPKTFHEVYTKVIKSLSSQSSRTYVINIVPGRDALYIHSPGLKESIIKYNEIINGIVSDFKNVKLVDVYDEFQNSPELYLTDDLHITKTGHEHIYERIRVMEMDALQPETKG
jgi:acyl-CoA thioesterase I